MSETRLAHRVEDGHWLTFSDDRLIIGCHCGFVADMESDAGYGDSVLDHFEAVVRAEERASERRTEYAVELTWPNGNTDVTSPTSSRERVENMADWHNNGPSICTARIMRREVITTDWENA
ncbi:MAG TPA: hypothetical protein VFH54_19405 [Mycobacteriales bacterium]|nr:hypothetical protein [Mycobacteriales bacterium]